MENFLADIYSGFSAIASFYGFAALIAGCILGIIGGALPGLSPATAVALLVPFSFQMEPTIALSFLTAVYLAANYGGSITAITLNTPGTPASAVTAIDAFAMTKKGEAKKALHAALFGSTFGGLVGVIILIALAIPLGKIALKFDSASYFSLALFGLLSVILMDKNKTKVIFAISLGLLIKSVGIDPISGQTRFTFGLDEMYEGFGTIPALIGLFAVSQILLDSRGPLTSAAIDKIASRKDSAKEIWSQKLNALRSSIIGTIIGIFPGAGSTIASFVSYDIAKVQNCDDEFGKGSVKGVIASEAANSSSVGGALVPLLALGIPGSATDAVLIGAFMLHNLNPGPLLLKNETYLVYGIFISLLIANLLIYILGKSSTRLFVKISQIRKDILFPIVLSLSFIGCYSINSSLFDAFTCLIFGLLGWLLKSFKYPVSSVVLAMVLASMLEENLRRALIEDGFRSFLHPLPLTILVAPFILSWLFKRKRGAKVE